MDIVKIRKHNVLVNTNLKKIAEEILYITVSTVVNNLF